MNDFTIDNESGARVTSAEELDGVRTARVVSFFIDYLIVGLLCIPFAVIIGVLGVVTLGLAWGLYAFLPGIVAVIYLAITMGGPQQATIGMRFMGVQIKKLDGTKVDAFLAVLHGILFWVINFTVFMLAISFFSSKKRLAQDILLGTYVGRV